MFLRVTLPALACSAPYYTEPMKQRETLSLASMALPGASSPSVRQASFGDLPDEALQKILQHLTLTARHRTVALVCKRWREAVASPQLLHSATIAISGTRFLPRLRALADWLALVAAPHLQRLHLNLACPQLDFARPELEGHEVRGMVPGMLAACGAGGQLTELQLNLNTLSIPISSWIAALGGSLQVLRIQGAPLQVTGPLQALTKLQELELTGAVVQPAARLPACITRLSFSLFEGQWEMPPQVSALTALVSLAIRRAGIIPSGYRVLTKLGNLQNLLLDRCRHLPACLPQLTTLKQVTIYNPCPDMSPEEAKVDSLRAALPRLTNMTGLAFSPLPGMECPPDEVSGLPLVRLSWYGGCPERCQVPMGAWLATVRVLDLPAGMLANSMQQMQAAQQLVDLTVTHADACPAGTSAIVRWAVHLPGLQHLIVKGASLPCSVCDALLDAQRRRPGLLIKVKPRA